MMAHHLTVSDRILEVMRGIPDCRLDALVLSCPGFPLQVVLSELSRLSREDQLQLTLLSTGFFTVQLLSANGQPRRVRSPLTREGTMKRDNVKSQKGRNSKKSDTARTLDGVRVCQPRAVYLTCNERELEALMSKGESS
jgi:hypothetical protein